MQTLQKPNLNSQQLTSPHEKIALILDRLSGVKECANGYQALCPAHADRNPSLSIKTGYKAILLKCWCGCSIQNIVQALGLSESDLFFDEPHSRFHKNNGTRYQQVNFNYRWNWRKSVSEILNITETQAILADDVLRQSVVLDTTILTDAQRDSLTKQTSLAASWIRLSESLSALCFDVAQNQRRMEATR